MIKYFTGSVFLGLICVLGVGLVFASFQKTEAGEYAVVFSAFPTWAGGGVRKKVLAPKTRELLWPWETMYRLDASLQSISWGGLGQGDRKKVEDYVETRASDGNEVGLAMTVQYRIRPDMLGYVVQNVGVNNKDIRRLVEAVSRADIRTHMNSLHTLDFFNPKKRQEAVDRVKEALQSRLYPEGIEIAAVIYNDHRFERHLPQGKIDRSYQQQIDETQANNQSTEREKKRIAAVTAKKRQEFNEAQARVNRKVEEIEGFKRQSTLRGDAYIQAKKNEAEKILTVGMAEVEGLKQQIAALSGPGGEALLRLSLVKELLARNPNFILVNNEGGDSGLNFNRLDTNELIRQIGVAAGTAEGVAKAKEPVRSAPAAKSPEIKPQNHTLR